MNPRHTFCTIASTLMIAAVAFTPPVAGDDTAVNHAYEMSVVVDRAYGELVARGGYERAILRIASHPNHFPFATATNLCVAHTMVGQYRHASRYCDEALEIAGDIAQAGVRKDRDPVTEWALAFSNRGVLRARMGDPGGAEQDFRQAISLHCGSDVPVHNLARLGEEIGEPLVRLD